MTQQRRQPSADSGQRRYPRTTWCSFMRPPAAVHTALSDSRERHSRSAFPTLPRAASAPAADPAYARLPRALGWTLSRPGAQLVYSQLPLERSTGLEPVTSRFSVWCSAIELRQLTANFRTPSRNASHRSIHEAQCAAGERHQSDACLQETPAGVEPAASCFAGSRLTVWLQRQLKSPAANDGRSWVIRL